MGQAGPGAAAFVVISRPGRDGHALALVRTGDGGLAVVNPASPGQHSTGPLTGSGTGPLTGLLGPLTGRLGPVAEARALVVGPAGQVIPPAASASASVVRALTDPAHSRISGKAERPAAATSPGAARPRSAPPASPADLQKLKDAVDNAGEAGLTRTPIFEMFHNHRNKDGIDALLGQLAAGYPGEYRTWEVPTAGNPAVYVGRWFDRPGPDGQRRRFPDPPGARYVQPLGDPVPATRREADLRRLKLAIGEKKGSAFPEDLSLERCSEKGVQGTTSLGCWTSSRGSILVSTGAGNSAAPLKLGDGPFMWGWRLVLAGRTRTRRGPVWSRRRPVTSGCWWRVGPGCWWRGGPGRVVMSGAGPGRVVMRAGAGRGGDVVAGVLAAEGLRRVEIAAGGDGFLVAAAGTLARVWGWDVPGPLVLRGRLAAALRGSERFRAALEGQVQRLRAEALVAPFLAAGGAGGPG